MDPLLDALLGHCRTVLEGESGCMQACNSAHKVLSTLSQAYSPFVARRVSSFMLDLLDLLLASPVGVRMSWYQKKWAFEQVVHILDSPPSPEERQRWFSTLTCVMGREGDIERQRRVFACIELLWRAEGAPWESYSNCISILEQVCQDDGPLRALLQDA